MKVYGEMNKITAATSTGPGKLDQTWTANCEKESFACYS